jgi:hypothetical protein
MALQKNFEKFSVSMLFSSLITTWHALFFPIRVNSRVVLQPWLLQQGFLPYVQIGDEHAPLLPYILSWLSQLFNADGLFTARFLHGFLVWLIIFVSVWFTFQRGGRWAAFACGAFFFVASNSLGFWAMWYDLAVAPIFLLAFFVIIHERPLFTMKMFLIGTMTGIGFLLKQHALLLALLVPLALFTNIANHKLVWRDYVKPGLLSLVGFLIPISLYLVYFFSQSPDGYALWYWLIEFNLVGEYSALGAKAPTLPEIRGVLPLFVMILPFAFTTFHLGYIQQEKRQARERWWLLFMMLLTAVMLYPRYSTMHWAATLPFLAIASGIACGEIVTSTLKDKSKSFQTYKHWGLYLAIVGVLWVGPGTFNYMNVFIERENRTFIEYDGLPALARQITQTTPLGNILLFPDDEGVGNLYYLLEKEPPRFWLMNYPWFRNEYETERWLTTVANDPPDQIIYFTSRGPQRYPELDQFISQGYQTMYQLEWNNQVVEIKERIPGN